MNGPSDWKKVFNNDTIPKSCCDELQSDFECNIAQAHKHGCMPTLLDFLQNKALILGGVGVGIAFVQVFFFFFLIRDDIFCSIWYNTIYFIIGTWCYICL